MLEGSRGWPGFPFPPARRPVDHRAKPVCPGDAPRRRSAVDRVDSLLPLRCIRASQNPQIPSGADDFSRAVPAQAQAQAQLAGEHGAVVVHNGYWARQRHGDGTARASAEIDLWAIRTGHQHPLLKPHTDSDSRSAHPGRGPGPSSWRDPPSSGPRRRPPARRSPSGSPSFSWPRARRWEASQRPTSSSCRVPRARRRRGVRRP